jgi:dolichyl-phosphate-mannose-protein mannosyltransferase
VAEIDTVDTQERTIAPEPVPLTQAARWRACLPEALPVAVAGFGVPAMVLLQLGWFAAPLVLVLGLAGAAAAVWLLGPERLVSYRFGSSRWTLAALLLAAAFAVLNAPLATQNLYAERDPSTYLATGQWLAHHGSLPVPVDSEVFEGPTSDGGTTSDVYGYSAGFGNDIFKIGYVAAQGNHLLPAMLAVVGWSAGERYMVMLNCLFGAIALLALFGLARRLAGDGFAFAATAALAVSMPMLEFSRDSYTEPLALLLLFGGLSVLWRAVESGRVAEFGLAGLTAGSCAMARIDGVLPMLAFVAVGYCYLARARAGQRREALVRVGTLFAGLTVPVLLGYVDVSRLSSAYYMSRRHEIVSSLKDVVAVVALGVPLVAVVWLVPRVRALITGRWRPRVAVLAAAGVPVLMGLFVLRPLWEVGHERPDPGQPCNTLVLSLQQKLGEPVTPCRTYDEYTVHWIAWYFGWPTIALATLGLALLVRRVIRDADLRLLGLVAMTSAMCLVYLRQSRITPDQVWAMRRYLPVVLPGLLAAAATMLAWLAARPWRYARQVAAGLAVLAVAVPAFITHPLERVRQDGGELDAIRTLCDRAGPSGAVLAVGDSTAARYLQTIRSTCGIPAAGLQLDDDVALRPPMATVRADLARVRQTVRAHGRTLLVISQRPDMLPWTGGTPSPLYAHRMQRWEQRLMEVPQQPVDVTLTLYVADVLPDGSVRD